jgi:hypothetical protein
MKDGGIYSDRDSAIGKAYEVVAPSGGRASRQFK